MFFLSKVGVFGGVLASLSDRVPKKNRVVTGNMKAPVMTVVFLGVGHFFASKPSDPEGLLALLSCLAPPGSLCGGC